VTAAALAALDAQTLGDAVGLGATYALMAVGIGLVFGVLRLVNFAYGQVVMAGAYTLAFVGEWRWLEDSIGSSAVRTTVAIAACVAVAVAVSLGLELTVFRPLRGQSPAVMLVTTFAVAFLLQNVALLVDIRDDTLGESATPVASLGQAVTIAGVEVRKVTIVAVLLAAAALGLLAFLLARTDLGLHMRAASADFTTARMLGVRGNSVIAWAVLFSGLLAGVVAVMLTASNPFVTYDYALRETIVVLVGVVVGGIDRLWTATLGGFSIGFASGVINGALPTDKSVYLPSALFALVIVVLLVRPAGLFVRGRATSVERV
jgi:branched-chain amino acid transport system permease protein